MKSRLLLAVCFLTISIVGIAQTQTIKIPLKIEVGKTFTAFVWSMSLTFAEKEIASKSPLGNAVRIERTPDNKDRFQVTIDQNDSNNFSPRISFEIGIDDKKIFSQQVSYQNGKSLWREFEFTSQRDPDNKNDNFWIKSNYSAHGMFQTKNCRVSLGLYDIIPNGDLSDDFKQGSNLGIDRNKDGKFSGKGEWLFSDMIIDLCGKNYLITKIAPDGSYFNLKPTNLQNVKLYQESPKFDFTLVNNKSLSSETFRGKPYLIDFWATWCGACLAKMPEIKQLEGTLPIIYFNTDTLKRKPDALKLIDQLNIAENSVLRTSPKAGNFYKSYQRFFLPLPFYVLIDGEGRFRYGGGGGENLQELKNKIAEISKSK